MRSESTLLTGQLRTGQEGFGFASLFGVIIYTSIAIDRQVELIKRTASSCAVKNYGLVWSTLKEGSEDTSSGQKFGRTSIFPIQDVIESKN